MRRCLACLRYLVLLAGAVLWLGASAAETVTTYRIGITAFRDKGQTLREWTPTMDYLSAQVPNSHFVAVPMNLQDFEIALRRREIDFVITNPEHYIIMEALFGVSRVATLVKREQGRLVNQFGGVVFTRTDRDDIRRLEDVKGKRIASVDHNSFAGFLLQYDLLLQNGVNLDRDCQVTFLGFPQDLSVRAVLDGKTDVGFVRTGVLEAMAHEGKIDLASIRVIGPNVSADFPFLLSTGLYPEWPLAAAHHAPIDITNQVVAALLTMPADGPAARAARYERWATPLEYQSVQRLMQKHRLYPYDKPESIRPADVIRQYAATILGILLLLLSAMGALYFRSLRLNRALDASRQELTRLAHHDPLTGLPNRNLLDYDLDKAIGRAHRTGTTVAVCLMDLDGFKPINDVWGHRVGDDVLKETARRLLGVIRQGDTVARWGGDEFVLVLQDIADEAQLREIMDRVLLAIAAPIDFCASAQVHGSIGICLYPQHSGNPGDLLKHADDAMYVAKRRGGNRYALWSMAIMAEQQEASAEHWRREAAAWSSEPSAPAVGNVAATRRADA